MTRKTAPEIEQDLYDLAASFFEGRISGSVYMSDTRPADSNVEDVVVCQPRTSGEQFQKGLARFLCFVPDFDIGSGHLVPDKARIQELTHLHNDFLEFLNSGQSEYIFCTFGEIAPTGSYPDSKEHFIDFQFTLLSENF